MVTISASKSLAVAVVVAALVGCLWACATAIAAGDVNESECPLATESSPGFRPFMPGCSAYEMVTPPYAGGGYIQGTVKSQLPAMTAGGDRVLGLVDSGFAGTEDIDQVGNQAGAFYEFVRTLSGWAVEALNPPAETYPRQAFVFASADLTRSLWKVQDVVQAGHELPPVPPDGVGATNNFTLLLREAAGGGKGRFAVVGPVAAPNHEPGTEAILVRGASSDLSHILLDVRAVDKQLWPGDETFESDESLYEYSGAGGEPVLVGVSNKGSLVEAASAEHKAHVNEAAQLISRCGIAAGGQVTETNHEKGVLDGAISSSGNTVFFTALACPGGPLVNELYARVDGSETVDISEPSTGPGGDCVICDVREPRPAVFAGASEDGSKVFFYSEQELLPKAAGENLYEYNFDAANPHERLTLVAPDVERVAAISGDGSHVYFESSAALNGSANGNGETAVYGAENLYVYNTDAGTPSEPAQPVFVAQEAGRQYVTRHGRDGEETPGVDVTRDGRFAVFGSRRHVAGSDDLSSVAQIFEYDANTGRLARVSVGAAVPGECEVTHMVEPRYGCDGNVTSEEDIPELAPAPYSIVAEEYLPTNAASSLSIAANGVVVFQSRAALTPGAASGGRNVYEYRSGEVFLVSPGNEVVPFEREAGELRLLGISELGFRDSHDGEESGNVFLSTSSQLVPQDTNTQEDWYDAREYGGFSGTMAQPECVGEACEGATSAPPVVAATGPSETTFGGTNFVAPPAVVSSVTRPSVGTQQAKALKACKKYKRVSRRKSCEKQVRRHYASSHEAAPPRYGNAK